MFMYDVILRSVNVLIFTCVQVCYQTAGNALKRLTAFHTT